LALTLDATEQGRIREYLLGNMPSAELSQLEERLLTDKEYYEELLISEDELIDQYLGNHLSEAERTRFETHFLLTPERQRKMRFARSLKKYVATATEPALGKSDHSDSRPETNVVVPLPKSRRLFWQQKSLLSYSLAAAAALILAVGSLLLLTRFAKQSNVEPGKVVIAVLTPGGVRDPAGTGNRVSVPADTDKVELDLVLADDTHSAYRAIVVGDDGSEVWKSEDLQGLNKEGRRVLPVSVPANLLPQGDYRIRLSGKIQNNTFEDLPSYNLRVTQ
jgi:hypothetical protein